MPCQRVSRVYCWCRGRATRGCVPYIFFFANRQSFFLFGQIHWSWFQTVSRKLKFITVHSRIIYRRPHRQICMCVCLAPAPCICRHFSQTHQSNSRAWNHHYIFAIDFFSPQTCQSRIYSTGGERIASCGFFVVDDMSHIIFRQSTCLWNACRWTLGLECHSNCMFQIEFK